MTEDTKRELWEEIYSLRFRLAGLEAAFLPHNRDTARAEMTEAILETDAAYLPAGTRRDGALLAVRPWRISDATCV